jgi:hypothetical protein
MKFDKIYLLHATAAYLYNLMDHFMVYGNESVHDHIRAGFISRQTRHCGLAINARLYLLTISSSLIYAVCKGDHFG